MFGRLKRLVETFEPVLGTTFEIQFEGKSLQKLQERRDVALEVIPRLESIFSIFRLDSELGRFNNTVNEAVQVSPELASVLEVAHNAWLDSNGVFHPCGGGLAEVWRNGGEVGEVVEELKIEPFKIDGQFATKYVHLPINLNAVAKGYIVDRCLEAACGYGELKEGVVNIGGDLRHLGMSMRGVTVEIRDPRSDAANSEVLSVVKVWNAGLASSGQAMRPVMTPNGPVSHVFDPRTGQPVEHWAGVSVISSSAMRADLFATILMVLSFEEGLDLVADMDGTEFFGVTPGGKQLMSPGWLCNLR